MKRIAHTCPSITLQQPYAPLPLYSLLYSLFNNIEARALLRGQPLPERLEAPGPLLCSPAWPAQHSQGVRAEPKVWQQPAPTELRTSWLPLPGPYPLQVRNLIRQQHQHAQVSAGKWELQDLHFLCRQCGHIKAIVHTHHLHRFAFLLQNRSMRQCEKGAVSLEAGRCASPSEELGWILKLCLHFPLLSTGVLWMPGQTQFLPACLGLSPMPCQQGAQKNHGPMTVGWCMSHPWWLSVLPRSGDHVPYLCYMEGHFSSVFCIKCCLPHPFEVDGINKDQRCIKISGAWYKQIFDLSCKKEAKQWVLRHSLSGLHAWGKGIGGCCFVGFCFHCRSVLF